MTFIYFIYYLFIYLCFHPVAVVGRLVQGSTQGETIHKTRTKITKYTKYKTKIQNEETNIGRIFKKKSMSPAISR